jgi:hypothetical protein
VVDNLMYRREDLVRILKERLAEREQARTDAETERAQRDVDISERVAAAMVEHPMFLIWMNAQCRSIGLDLADDGVMEAVGEIFDAEVSDPYDADAELTKQIRVLETAADEMVQVRVTDNIYAYL